MRKQEIVHIALENLHKNVGLDGKWIDFENQELDGQLEILIENQLIVLNAEIKQELRNHQLPQIISRAKQLNPFIIIAQRIFPKIKDELRGNKIAYLEANGNTYINNKNLILWIDGQKALETEREKGNRAFTKTGLKVLFHFLLDQHLIQQGQRDIANITNVGLGNVNYILTGLKELNFLIEVRKQEFRLNNKKELLEKWMVAYEERLKPALLVGTFRFLRETDFQNWKNLEIDRNTTKWGGEPAADLYTNYLHPQILTLYTTETRNEIINKYRLIPSENGNVKVYKRFWHFDDGDSRTVPPLLIYTDLMNTNDRRCIETAQKIYDEFLQNKL